MYYGKNIYINDLFKDVEDKVSDIYKTVSNKSKISFDLRADTLILIERLKRLKMLLVPYFEYRPSLDDKQIREIFKAETIKH